MPDHRLAGVYAAALTPLYQDLSPDPLAILAVLDFLAARGCHGALLFGSTGEGPSFSPGERERIFHASAQVRASRPDFRLLAGTGTPSLQESIDLTRSAFDAGFDGVVVLPPYYFRKVGDAGLFEYFAALIRQAVPGDGYLLGYHIPGMAGVGFSLDLLARLKDAFPVQFAGLKDSSHNLEFARDLGSRFGSDLLVLNGTDSYLTSALEAHAQGCITAPANLISPGLRQVWDLYRQGQDASAAQSLVTGQREVLERYAPFPIVLKALFARLHGFPRWPVRPPLEDLPDGLVDQALAELEHVGAHA